MSSRIDWSAKMRQLLPRMADKVVQRAQTKLKTKKLDRFKISGVENPSPSTFRITITNDAPMAGAYEFGSGVHRQSGGGTYPIVAHDPIKKPLHFFWKREGRWFRGPKVNHPGVEAVPFMKPAVNETAQEFVNELGNITAEIIYKSIRDAWEITK